MTYAKLLGSGMKYDTYDPNSAKICNELFSSLTADLKTFCKPLPILLFDSSAAFHSLCAFLILSRIFSLSYLALISGCTWFPCRMSSRKFVLIDPLLGSLSVD